MTEAIEVIGQIPAHEWAVGGDGQAHWTPLDDEQAVCGIAAAKVAREEPTCFECAARAASGRPDWATIARWEESFATLAPDLRPRTGNSEGQGS